ncbi:2-C-methyl-D-erythritol 4-phosphate cytidylyltransferase [Rhodoferax sp.]|uniref:2-C-methyl-D-erythritol 4-phosphate cytidylyltransferase n=1 Tax=Rhodoferax sp. TaxID=50421 RepID=UPI0025E1838D|nr:2-C-methyl-D-erythritol 4-phosphate cytidylyltransferase [Rhodoferax sp.]
MNHTQPISPAPPETAASLARQPRAGAPGPAAASPRLWGLVPCAGSGSRSGAMGPKQYTVLGAQALVLHTLEALTAVDRLAGVQVVVSEGDPFFDTAPPLAGAPVFVADCGGSTRAGSVLNGLSALLEQGAQPLDWVLVHDAARCLITAADVQRLIDACQDDPVGGLLALKLPDTLKQEHGGRVAATLDRSDKWLAQTPQMFRIGALQAAYLAAGDAVTDEASALEFVGQHPKLVEGSAQNFKVTYPQDFALAVAVLAARAKSAQGA